LCPKVFKEAKAQNNQNKFCIFIEEEANFASNDAKY
jgi:hypothetical protein